MGLQVQLFFLLATWCLAAASSSSSPFLRSSSQSRQLSANETDHELELKHADFFASRRRLQNAVRDDHPDHQKSWSVLADVNGLKNSEVGVFITSTTNNGQHFLWDRVIPSARTWMRLFANVFVIVEDNFLLRYALRQCHYTEFPSYTMFSCHNEPHYLLTRNCTNEYYAGNGICCKIDDAINFAVNEHTELFAGLKYMVEGDDDTFFRPEQVLRWLSAVENSGISSELPLVANAEKTNARGVEHGGVWHVHDCSDIKSNGWYQPMMLNRKALELLAFPSKNYGFRETCNAFYVSQDVGFGPYAWLFGLWHIYMPGVEINGPHAGVSILKPNQMIVHGIKHDALDNCDQPQKWPANLRYNQHVAVGCGDLTQKNPFHDPNHMANMYDVWNYFNEKGENLYFDQDKVHDWVKRPVVLYPTPTLDGKIRVKHVVMNYEEHEIKDGMFRGDKVEYRLIPSVNKLEGFDETEFSKKHDLQKQWTTFKPEDCKNKGHVDGWRKP